MGLEIEVKTKKDLMNYLIRLHSELENSNIPDYTEINNLCWFNLKDIGWKMEGKWKK